MPPLPDLWYHATDQTFRRFSWDWLHQGNHDRGLGFYFTADPEDARRYGKLCYTVRFKQPRWIEGPPQRGLIRGLLQRAPALSRSLTDWDENRERAFEMALSSICEHETLHEAFQAVWYDFYRNQPQRFCREIVRLGYFGSVFPVAHTLHAVVVDPRKIEIVCRETWAVPVGET